MVKIHWQLRAGLFWSLDRHIDIEHQNLLAVWSTRFLFESLCVNLGLPFKTVGAFIQRPHFFETLLLFIRESILSKFIIWILFWSSIFYCGRNYLLLGLICVSICESLLIWRVYVRIWLKTLFDERIVNRLVISVGREKTQALMIAWDLIQRFRSRIL